MSGPFFISEQAVIDLHEDLFSVLVVVASAHIAAALWHHLFRGDATLARMLPRGWVDEGRRDA